MLGWSPSKCSGPGWTRSTPEKSHIVTQPAPCAGPSRVTPRWPGSHLEGQECARQSKSRLARKVQELGAQRQEGLFVKRLREDVRDVVCGRDVLDAKDGVEDEFSDLEMAALDVLRALVDEVVLRDTKTGCV